MFKKVFLGIACFMCSYAYSQATIKGRVTEKDGETPIEFAVVRLMQNDSVILETVTDERGRYILYPVRSGKYDRIYTFAGYKEYKEDIEIYGGITVIRDTKLISLDDKLTYKELYKPKNDCRPRFRIRLFR